MNSTAAHAANIHFTGPSGVEETLYLSTGGNRINYGLTVNSGLNVKGGIITDGFIFGDFTTTLNPKFGFSFNGNSTDIFWEVVNAAGTGPGVLFITGPSGGPIQAIIGPFGNTFNNGTIINGGLTVNTGSPSSITSNTTVAITAAQPSITSTSVPILFQNTFSLANVTTANFLAPNQGTSDTRGIEIGRAQTTYDGGDVSFGNIANGYVGNFLQMGLNGAPKAYIYGNGQFSVTQLQTTSFMNGSNNVTPNVGTFTPTMNNVSGIGYTIQIGKWWSVGGGTTYLVDLNFSYSSAGLNPLTLSIPFAISSSLSGITNVFNTNITGFANPITFGGSPGVNVFLFTGNTTVFPQVAGATSQRLTGTFTDFH